MLNMVRSDSGPEKIVSSADSSFDDIRPCNDDEVSAELRRIVSDRTVINSILKFRYPILSRHLTFFLKLLVKSYLNKKIKGIKNIADFQHQVADFMTHMIDSTTDGVTYEGFDKLDKNCGYLFISNHRDISLDPAFIDMALYLHHLETVRIAIGDNLLKMPAVTSLMRLNKSFIVKRSVNSPREKLKALKHLSAYIGLSVHEGHSVWIAQREGRAKDGDDRTEGAVLKMLSLYGRELGQKFADYMSSLHIVPVSISYEFDPNDLAKAHELDERARHEGHYNKEQLEDIDTITRGIREYKGRVKIVAGAPVSGGFESAEELAAVLDDFIWKNYALYPSTLIAAGAGASCTEEEKARFSRRIGSYPEELKTRVLSMYARPYLNLQQTLQTLK